ncbi:MAG: NUDIX hydrolase [Clostridia bacterium]|nr:NUDIX hydrolase [Clostridia bacterium]
MKLVKIKKLTKQKFLNLYELTYKNKDGKLFTWIEASRFDTRELVCINGKVKANCVCIIPKTIIDGEPALIITKEFRLPINNYVYGFPAGMIDGNESPELAAIRELYEEIGAKKFGKVSRLTDACLNSEGLTDESTITLEVEVLELGKQHLEETEDITYEIVKVKDLNYYLKDKILGAKLGIYAPMIVQYYKLEQKVKKLEEQLSSTNQTPAPENKKNNSYTI